MPWPPAAMAPSTPHWTPPPRQNACWMPSHGCAMFDLVELRAAVTAHTRVARIVIAGFDGSSPREVGAAMLVWQGGQSGTIGGGALEWLAMWLAPAPGEPVIARPVESRPTPAQAMPLAVKRLLATARGMGHLPAPHLLQGWMIEPVARHTRHLWIWGAGRARRAVVGVMAPLPDLAITWIDVAQDRFPATIPDTVRALPVADPTRAIALAPQDDGA